MQPLVIIYSQCQELLLHPTFTQTILTSVQHYPSLTTISFRIQIFYHIFLNFTLSICCSLYSLVCLLSQITGVNPYTLKHLGITTEQTSATTEIIKSSKYLYPKYQISPTIEIIKSSKYYNRKNRFLQPLKFKKFKIFITKITGSHND